ncbi:MAG: hypothetical protein HY708_03700, partial [Ignavibacteriae bacterium]|nr:hypothetical protein [Ignavibacteriota bacterium]
MKIFLRIVRYIRPHLGYLGVANLFMLLFIIFNIASIGLIMPLVDVVFSPPQTFPSEGEEISILNLGKYVSHHLARIVAEYDRYDVLLFLTIGIVVSFLLKNLFSYLNSIFNAHVEQTIMHTLRVDVYSHMQNLSLSYYTEERKGNMIATVINDVR